ncbi:hypothetical protein Q7P37_001771 [Cladosporium fusiforme]
MKWTNALLLLPAVWQQAWAARDYDAHDYYAVHLSRDVHPDSLSSHLGLQYEGPLGNLEDHHVFRTTRSHGYDHIKSAIKELKWRRRKRDVGWDEPHVLDNVLLSQKQELHKRFPLVKRDALPPLERDPTIWPRQKDHLIDSNVQTGLDIAEAMGIKDPIFQDQWHLYNHVQTGHDLNVTGVWEQGITGKNATISIVDDGLDMDSDDLKDNYFAKGSYDFNDDVEDPKPRLSDDKHGTRCAGEVAAVKNGVCGVGVAYDSKVAGERILSKIISDADEAVAMNYAFDENHIYSCSWGPSDNGEAMERPGILIRRAMVNGVQKGRDGLGSIYVFAIGNGAANDDDCNFDGYTNSIYSVSVGGIDRKGLHPYYSEKCSAQLVVTYSSGSGDAIHTTDVGKDKCYTNHGGTSAAGPLVAGIYALMLEANPGLNWRDFQYITALTAIKVDQPSDWKLNKAIGKEFSHQYGYGKADAYAMVEMAKTWKNVKPQAWLFSPWQHVKHDIPQGEKGLASKFKVTKEMMKKNNLERVEHVTVIMNVEHTRRGDLSVELHSPSGMVSHIATHRRKDNAHQGYIDWEFMSVAHWGEDGIGDWTVIVKDTKVDDNKGTFTDWRLKLWGESIDGDKQDLLPLPNEYDDNDHDREDGHVDTTSVAVPTVTGAPPGNPSDHIDRPVNNKGSSSSSTTPTASATNIPSEQDTTPTASPTSTNFLPHPFPTFGASKHTQVWIYGSAVLIVAFLAAIGGWWYYMRRKRQRWMSRDEYGFEMVEADDADDAAGVVNRGGGAGRNKRAGELYDAFAEGSDEETPFDLGSESEEESEDEGRGGWGEGAGEV